MGQPTGHMDRPGCRVTTTSPLDDSGERFIGEHGTIMAAYARKLGNFECCGYTAPESCRRFLLRFSRHRSSPDSCRRLRISRSRCREELF